MRLEKNDYFLDIYSSELPGTDVKVQEALLKTTGLEVSTPHPAVVSKFLIRVLNC